MQAEAPVPPTQGIGRTAVGGVAWNLGGQVLDRILGFIAFAIVVRLLTVELAGVVMLAASAIDMVAVLAFAGVGDRIIQHHAPDRRMLSTAFWLQMGMTLVLVAGLSLGAGGIASLLGEQRIVPLLHVLALVLLPQAAAIVPSSILARRLRFRDLSLCSLGSSFLSAGAGITVALAGEPFWALVVQRMTATVVFMALVFWLTRWRPDAVFDRAIAGETLRFTLPLMGSALTQSVHTHASPVLIGAFLPIEAVAYYRVAARLADVVWQFSLGPITRVFLSVFSVLRADRERARRAFLNILTVVACVTYASYAIIAGTGPEVMTLLFGPEWALSGQVFTLMACAAITMPLGAFVGPALTAAGRTRLVFLFHLASLSAMLATVPIAAQFGLFAVLYTAIGRSVLLSPLPFFALFLAFGVTAPGLLAVLATPIAAAIAGGLVADQVIALVLPHLGTTRLALPAAILLAWAAGGTVFLVVQGALAYRRSREVVTMLLAMLRRGGTAAAVR
jgi:O-antigen/teichoic acid export membrane protein